MVSDDSPKAQGEEDHILDHPDLKNHFNNMVELPMSQNMAMGFPSGAMVIHFGDM